MKLQPGSERMIIDDKTNPLIGHVRWAPAKSLWIGTMTAAAVFLGPIFFTWSGLLLFWPLRRAMISFRCAP